MAQDKPRETKQDLEAEVWTAISAFEQILEAMPNDRASLEALANAYEQIGDHTRMREYLLRLGKVLVEEADVDASRELLPKLKSLSEQDPDFAELVGQIEQMGVDSADARPQAEDFATAAEAEKPAVKVRSTFNMADELSFAWTLMEANELTQEEYASVVQDLTEMSATESAVTVSVLHVLEARQFKNLHKILGFVAKDCGTPIVTLEGFEVQTELAALLPSDFVIRRGALVFETFGPDALVAVMNPYDKQLRKDVETLAGRRCHFYIALPSDFDKMVGRFAESLVQKA